MQEDSKTKIATLAKELARLKQAKTLAEQVVKDINERIQEVSRNDLVKALEEAELKNANVAGVGLVYLQDSTFVSVREEDRASVYAWLKENGHGDLIKEHVWPQTLTAFVKELRSLNEPVPDNIRVTVIPTVVLRGDKSNG